MLLSYIFFVEKKSRKQDSHKNNFSFLHFTIEICVERLYAVRNFIWATLNVSLSLIEINSDNHDAKIYHKISKYTYTLFV